MLLILLACSSESALVADDPPAPGDAADPATDVTRVPAPVTDGPAIVALEGDLAAGVTVTSEAPFRSVRLVVAGDVTERVEVATGDGWAEVIFGWTEGQTRIAELLLDASATELTVRGAADWAQVELAADAPIYDDDPTPAGSERRARAVAGEWRPSAETLSIGMSWYLPYDYAESCTGYTAPGTATFAQWLVDNTEATAYGAYNCRSIAGSSSMSVHSEGRAIDLFVPLDGGDADNDLGDPIAAYLVEHAEEIGVHLVIWDRASWGAHRSGDKHESYTGTHPHHDHLHIELSWDAAWGTTDWFAAIPPFDGDAELAPVGWVDLDQTPSGDGYRLVHSDGRVRAFGDAADHGDLEGLPLAAPIAGIASTPSGAGYWLVGRDGGVFAFGDAPFLGSAAGLALAAPMVDLAPTPSGGGYWLTAEDGGVFAFGDARFLGSMGGVVLNAPVVGITGMEDGYWLAAADGGIFSFGAAPYAGSMGGTTLNAPVVAVDGAGEGYLMVAEDGGVFTFGGAPFYGSAADLALAAPVSGVAASADGYRFVALDGGVFAFGGAGYLGNALGE